MVRSSRFHAVPSLGADVQFPFAPAPIARNAVDGRFMSVDKDSSGLPEMNVHRRTTKVNLGIVVGVLIFFAAMAAVIVGLWLGHR